MATTMELAATPPIFGNEVLAHPQPQQKAVVLEECAKSLALRLGYGIEDVSFREFVDLVLASNSNSYCGETRNAPTISLLVEQDTAPSNRPSSVLRKVYFSSLNALHKIQDPPTKEDPPCETNMPSKTIEKDVDSNETERDGKLPLQDGKHDKHDSCDRPSPMGPLSRASTAKSSSTHSSWSSVSASLCMNQSNNYNNGGSFHFVSQFDDSDSDSDDNETWNGGEEIARMMEDHDDGETTDCDDKSMVVFLETGEEEPTNLQESWDWKSSYHKTPTIPKDHRKDSTRIDLPHDFEVVTVVSTHRGGDGDDRDGESSPLRGRTYSVTTTVSACSLQASSKPKKTKGKPSAVQSSGRSQSCGAVIASASSSPSASPSSSPSPSPSSSSTATTTFSSKFRKLLTLRSKSAGFH